MIEICEICGRSNNIQNFKVCFSHLNKLKTCLLKDCQREKYERSYFCDPHRTLIMSINDKRHLYWYRAEMVGVTVLNISTHTNI